MKKNFSDSRLEQSSKVNSRFLTIFFWFQLFILFIVLSTTDWEIFLSEGVIKIPTILLELKLTHFFYSAPLFLVCFLLLTKFHLARHNEKLSQYLPISIKSKKRIYPSIYDFSFAYSMAYVSIKITLNILPVLIMLFTLVIAAKFQDPVLTFFHFLILCSTIFIVYFYQSKRDEKLIESSADNADFLKKLISITRKAIMVFSYTLCLAVGILYTGMVVFPSFHKMAHEAIIFPLSKDSDNKFINSLVPSIKKRRSDYTIRLPSQELVLEKFVLKEFQDQEFDIQQLYPPLKSPQGRSFRFADLNSLTLHSVDFTLADLWGAKLYEAKLQGGNLTQCNLQGADLRKASLQMVDLEESKLQGALLQGALLRGAKLVRAELWGTSLEDTDLSGADLSSARLWAANLKDANLQGVDLRSADLQGADLQGADLRGAYLEGANLHGSYLSNTKLAGSYGNPIFSNNASIWDECFALLDRGKLPDDRKETFEDRIKFGKEWSKKSGSSEKEFEVQRGHNANFEKFIEARKKIVCNNRIIAERLLKLDKNYFGAPSRYELYQKSLLEHIRNNCPNCLPRSMGQQSGKEN